MKDKPLKQIGEFSLYSNSSSDMAYGSLYYKEFDIYELENDQKRMVYVYLPDGYDNNDKKRRYHVLYMHDGQNMVDSALSTYGKWDIDKHIKEMGVDLICVGIASSKIDEYRNRELCPSVKPSQFSSYPSTYLPKYGKFMFERLKPIIDSTFNTIKEKEGCGVGGSSMGGLASFALALYYKDLISFSLSFSPAFLLYNDKQFKELLKDFKINPKDYGKFYLYTGGVDFEKRFVTKTLLMHKHMQKMGFDNTNLALVYDSTQYHNEAAWSKYFKDAIYFWLGKK